jgi:2-methylcitrate dehydratase PrpD
MAALANGTIGHAFELDDCHDESLNHPGTVVIPAALAAAQQEGCSGLDFLVSVVLGYDVMGRVGLAVGAVSHMTARGFHPTGTTGVFGAATSVGRLLHQSPEQFVDAIGIGASLASGIMEFSQSGGMIKRLHAGRGAEGGVLAAYLAQKGFAGPAGAFEGAFGFYHCFSDDPRPDLLTVALGKRYMIRETTVKQYCNCGDLHAAIDALVEIKDEYSIDPLSVEEVVIEGSTKLATQNALDGTSSVLAAQYSAPYAVAVTLHYDIFDPQAYTERMLCDPIIKDFQNRVKVRATPEFDAKYPYIIGSRVIVIQKDGKHYSRVVNGAKGSSHRPFNQEDIEQKFHRMMKCVAPENIDAIIKCVANLDEAPSLNALTDLLRFSSAESARVTDH